MIVVQQGSCMVYEAWLCRWDNEWICANGAKWDLNEIGPGQRPVGWTSADAAGLSIMAGLARYQEVVDGEITHALRFTTHCSRDNYVYPATHSAVPEDDCLPGELAISPPMGMRVRLRADYDISGFSQTAQVFLIAMQTYGMILADNGSDFYFQSEMNLAWDDAVDELKQVSSDDFEVVEPGALEP
jgi:hypothetical protein